MKNILLVALISIVAFTTPANNITTPRLVKKLVVRPTGGLRSFMNRMGRIEGGGYDVVGGHKKKYLGMYQFHPNTLKSLGIDVEPAEFLSNPELQDSAMVLYMRDNAKDLRGIIKKFNNTYVGGVFVTKSGILAGAHLVGSAGVMSFFYPEKFSFKTTDGNGVHVSTYMKKFANYNLQGI